MIEREEPSSPTNDKYGSTRILVYSCRRSLYVGLYVSYFSISHKPISYPSLSLRRSAPALRYASTQNQLVAITKKFVTQSPLYPHPAAILAVGKATAETDTTSVSSSRTVCHTSVNKLAYTNPNISVRDRQYSYSCHLEFNGLGLLAQFVARAHRFNGSRGSFLTSTVSKL